MFKNEILEKFSHVHPATPILFWSPIVIYLFYYSLSSTGLDLSTWVVLSMALPSLFVWSFCEYILHRFVFHLPDWGPLSRKIEFYIHGVHHNSPNDKSRLVMPPMLGVVLAFVLYYFFLFFLGPVWTPPFFGYFVIGYLIYDYSHYYTHHGNPKSRFFKMVKHNHMTHHYACPDSRWGVSSPLWDFVFGTFSAKVTDKEHA